MPSHDNNPASDARDSGESVAAAPPLGTGASDGTATGLDVLHEGLALAESPPWYAQHDGLAVARVLSREHGWERLTGPATTALPTRTLLASPAERVVTLSFHAYTRPGQAIALILDPYATRTSTGPDGNRTDERVLWPRLHPDERYPLLVQAFTHAVVTDSPYALLAAVHDRRENHPDTDWRDIWQHRSRNLLADVRRHPSLPDRERASIDTLVALGGLR